MSNIANEVTPRLQIPRNNEIVVKEPHEIIAEHTGDPKGAVEALRAAAKASGKCGPDPIDEVDLLFSKITTSDAFLRKTIPKPPELIKGVLYKGDKMCLNAGSKVGKTWHLLKLGLSVSEGLPWLGMETVKCRVLFINFELQDHVTQDRIAKVKREILANVDTTNFSILNIRNLNMRSEKVLGLLPALADRLKDEGYGMIIFDPIYKLYGQGLDENSASDVANLLNVLETFARVTGASVVYSHHFAKGGQASKDSIDRASGSGVFARDPDAIINITALEDNDENTSYRVDMQLRSFKPVKPFGIRILEGRISLDRGLNLNKIKKPGQFKTVYTEKDILNVLNVKPCTAGDLLANVKEETGMSQTKFYELWKAVKATPGVSEVDGKWHYQVPGLTAPIPTVNIPQNN